MILFTHDRLALRTMADVDGDYQYLLRWLSDDRVAEHYGGRDQRLTFDDVRTKYGEKIRNTAYITPCLIERDGQPIGYLQFYETARDPEPSGKEPPLWLAPGTYNIDMF